MEMAQEKKGSEVGANTDVVLLAKASSPNDAGAGYYPVAAAWVQDLPEDLRRQIIGLADHGAVAYMLSGNNDASEFHSSPYAVQVLIDAAMGAKAGDPIPLAPAVMAARGGHGGLSAVVGIVAASTAVTALAGGVVNPAVVFGCFLVLLGGLALAMPGVSTP